MDIVTQVETSSNRPEKESSREPYEKILRELELDPIKNPLLIDRLMLLNERSLFLKDELSAMQYAEQLSEYLSHSDSKNKMSTEDLRSIKIGTLFSDIGKTGPRNATAEQQVLITAMYAVEGTDSSITVESFLKQNIPSDYSAQEKNLQALGVSPTMTMREFYDLHAGWSYTILKNSTIPPDGILAAVSHHMLRGVNPKQTMDPRGEFHVLGINRPVDQREIFVILLDQYDACLRRGNLNHSDAIAYLYNNVTQSKALEKLPELRKKFMSCIDDIAEAFAQKTNKLAA